MKIMTKLAALIALFFFTAAAFAQQGRNNGKPAAQKFKPPKLFTSIGNRSDSVIVSREEALQLISQPLEIHDANKGTYTISSYQFLYRRREVKEDDEMTGKVSPASTIVADLFKSTPLPDFWQKNIADQLKPGEEFTFYDVIVKDASGRLMFAPNLKIKVN